MKNDGLQQIMIFMVTLEMMVLVIQFMSTVILQNTVFGLLSFIPFIAIIGGFEYGYQKKSSEINETAKVFRKKFYKISVWLGGYFPIRFIMTVLLRFYPRSYNAVVKEGVILGVYVITAMLVTLMIEKYMYKE